MHIKFGRDCFLLFSKKYILNHDDVRRVTELYLSINFMFVNAAVSEIREWNQNKEKNFENDHSI